MTKIRSVLFVCLANICRSPAAAAILEKRIQDDDELKGARLTVESCGVGDWYAGQLPDERMRRAASARGMLLSGRANSFKARFFQEMDLILPVDHPVLYTLHEWAQSLKEKSKIRLATEFSLSYPNEDIPDPFFENDVVFDVVLDMLEDVCDGLVQYIKEGK